MKRQIQHAFVLSFLLLIPGNFARALTFHANLSSIKVNAAAGEIVNTQFALSIAEDQQRTQFRLHTQDFYRSEDGQKSYYRPAGTLTHSCANWVKINPAETAVEPGGTLNARLTINVPADVKPGGYWCVLTIDEVPDPLRVAPQGVGMQFLTSISVGMFVTVGTVTKSARIQEVVINADHANVKLADTGNCPFSADGRIEFMKPGQTNPIATVTFAKTALFCEPINTSILNAALPDAKTLPAGRYLVRVILDIGLDHYIGVQKEMDIKRDNAAQQPKTGTIQ